MKEYLRRILEETYEGSDCELSHINADKILCDNLHNIGGFEDILEAYDKVEKWYA